MKSLKIGRSLNIKQSAGKSLITLQPSFRDDNDRPFGMMRFKINTASEANDKLFGMSAKK